MQVEKDPQPIYKGKQRLDIALFIDLIKKNNRVMLLIVILCTAAGCSISFLIPGAFEGKTDLFVNYSSNEGSDGLLSPTEIDSNLRLIETYKYILTSDRIVNKVNEQLPVSQPKSELLNKVRVESNMDSQIISIIATAESREEAIMLSNTFASTFQEEMKRLMKFENVHILNKAKAGTDTKSVKPSEIIFLLLSITVGLLFSIIYLIIREVYFTKLDTSEKLEDTLQLVNLGTVPTIHGNEAIGFRSERHSKLIPYLPSSSLILEAFRIIRANIHFITDSRTCKTILLTSSQSGDGKSLISGNLAIAMSMDNRRTIYVDADLRKGNGRNLFHMEKRTGITNYVDGNAPLSKIIQKTEFGNLYYLGAGPLSTNSSELLSTKEMAELLEELKKIFEVIIIDSPPLLVSDAIVLAGLADSCILVADAKATKKKQAVQSMEKLRKVNIHVLGAILNKGKLPEGGEGYYY